MLHCPRCSGPLEVRPAQDNTKPHTNGTVNPKVECEIMPQTLSELDIETTVPCSKPITKPIATVAPYTSASLRPPVCPAGGSCPHSAQQPQPPSTIYLSGGCVTMANPRIRSPGTSSLNMVHTFDYLGSQVDPVAAPSSPTLVSVESPNQQQSSHSSFVPAGLCLPQLSHGSLFSSHLCDGSSVPASNLFHCHTSSSTPVGSPTTTTTQCLVQLPGQAPQLATPLFLTSTVSPLSVMSHGMVNSVHCQAATPGIIMASSGTPFFVPQSMATPNQGSMWVTTSTGMAPLVASSVFSIPQVPVQVPVPNVSECPRAVVKPSSPLSPVALNENIKANRSRLEQSHWYYPKLQWNDSSELLANTAPGTFLVRDSADPRFLFSLSVQRSDEGPTSVRIHFQGGKFSLDAEDSIRDLMPEFSSVVDLIEYYLSMTSAPTEDMEKKKQVWIDNVGKLSSPISLKKPLYNQVPSLGHFARLAINRGPSDVAQLNSRELELPTKLVEYLTDYPNVV